LVAARLDPARVWQMGAAALALMIGVLAGLEPRLGLAAAFAMAFVLLVLTDITTGLIIFVLVSFVDVASVGGAAVSFSKLVGLLLAVSWLAVMATRSERADFFRTHPAITLLAALFIGWSTLSVVWAEDAGRVLSTTQRYALNLCLLPIAYTAIRRREHLTYVAAAFVAGAVGSMLLGVATGASFAVTGDASRLAGGIGESNELATVLGAAIILSLALIASNRTPPLVRAGALVAAPLALAGIVATLSRAGLVALAVALFVGVIIGGRWRGWFAGALVVAATVGVIFLTVFASSAARERVQSTNSTGRSDIWTVGVRMVKANPVHGVGGGNFPVSSVHYLLAPGLIVRDDFILVTPKVAHNIYLEVQAELGIVGLVLFLSLIGFSLRCALTAAREFHRREDTQAELIARAVVIAIAGILAADFFASEQYSKQLWVLLALGPVLLRLSREPEEERTA
jgi:O-antigen ligase